MSTQVYAERWSFLTDTFQSILDCPVEIRYFLTLERLVLELERLVHIVLSHITEITDEFNPLSKCDLMKQ